MHFYFDARIAHAPADMLVHRRSLRRAAQSAHWNQHYINSGLMLLTCNAACMPQKEQSFEIKADVPGVDKKDIKLSVDGDVLSLSVHKTQSKEVSTGLGRAGVMHVRLLLDLCAWRVSCLVPLAGAAENLLEACQRSASRTSPWRCWLLAACLSLPWDPAANVALGTLLAVCILSCCRRAGYERTVGSDSRVESRVADSMAAT